MRTFAKSCAYWDGQGVLALRGYWRICLIPAVSYHDVGHWAAQKDADVLMELLGARCDMFREDRSRNPDESRQDARQNPPDFAAALGSSIQPLSQII